MFTQNQAGMPLPSYAYANTPFDDSYDAKKYQGGPTNPFEQTEKTEKPGSRMIVHPVRDGDSLVSLSLTYGVAIPLIKKANGITSDEIYYLVEIKIPNPRNVVYPDPPDAESDLRQTQATVRQAFKNRTGETNPDIVERFLKMTAYNFYDAVERYEKDRYEISKRKEAIVALKVKLKKDDRDDKTAAVYLESNDWNVAKAYEAYKEDLAHERGEVRGGASGPNQYQQIPQHGGFVPPGHFEMNYGAQYQSNYPGQQIQPQEYDQRFVYRANK